MEVFNLYATKSHVMYVYICIRLGLHMSHKKITVANNILILPFFFTSYIFKDIIMLLESYSRNATRDRRTTFSYIKRFLRDSKILNAVELQEGIRTPIFSFTSIPRSIFQKLIVNTIDVRFGLVRTRISMNHTKSIFFFYFFYLFFLYKEQFNVPVRKSKPPGKYVSKIIISA